MIYCLIYYTVFLNISSVIVPWLYLKPLNRIILFNINYALITHIENLDVSQKTARRASERSIDVCNRKNWLPSNRPIWTWLVKLFCSNKLWVAGKKALGLTSIVLYTHEPLMFEPKWDNLMRFQSGMNIVVWTLWAVNIGLLICSEFIFNFPLSV